MNKEKNMNNTKKLFLLSMAIFTLNPYHVEAKNNHHDNTQNRNEYGETLLIEAARLGEINQLLMLIKNGADVNAHVINYDGTKGYTALHIAQDATLIKALLKAEANVHAQDDMGMTPLHITNSIEKAKLLVQAGADVNAKAIYGITPLIMCMDGIGSYKMMEYLITSGAALNAYFDNGTIKGTPITMFFQNCIFENQDSINLEDLFKSIISQRAALE